MLTYEEYAYLRDQKGLRDSDVCKLTGITPATLSDWKHGRYTPKLEKMRKLLEVVGDPLLMYERSYDYDLLFQELAEKEEKKLLSREETALIDKYRLMNRAGKKELLEYADYMLSKPKYKGGSESDASSEVS